MKTNTTSSRILNLTVYYMTSKHIDFNAALNKVRHLNLSEFPAHLSNKQIGELMVAQYPEDLQQSASGPIKPAHHTLESLACRKAQHKSTCFDLTKLPALQPSQGPCTPGQSSHAQHRIACTALLLSATSLLAAVLALLLCAERSDTDRQTAQPSVQTPAAGHQTSKVPYSSRQATSIK